MNPQEQIKALAELDGWKFDSTDPEQDFNRWTDTRGVHYCQPLSYLTSYDAIIPLIQKQDDEVICSILVSCYTSVSFSPEPRVPSAIGYVRATPSQLCEALLRAIGKRKE